MAYRNLNKMNKNALIFFVSDNQESKQSEKGMIHVHIHCIKSSQKYSLLVKRMKYGNSICY